jgi:cytoskeletal protein CcmA (bactofilin family)
MNVRIVPIRNLEPLLIPLTWSSINMSAGIGQSIRIKGSITAQEPFLVAGHVEGTIEVSGNTLTVAEGANVVATISADTVVVQGTVNGATMAATRIVVQATAKLEGEFSAPSISVADGAIVHGRIETTGKKQRRAAA